MRRVALGLAALVLAFVLGALAMHFGMHAGQQGRLDALQAEVDAARATQASLLSGLADAQSRLAVEAGTSKTLQENLLILQQKLSSTRDQLAFYEQLIPPGPAGSVTIRAFDVTRQGALLRYRVLLTRNAPDQAQMNGRMRFLATGRQQDKTVKIELSADAAQAQAADPDSNQDAGVDPLDLAFDRLQRSAGVLRIPPGFVPKSVTLEILEDGAIRASRDTPVEGATASQQAIGAPK
ncbi:MAG: hypothetical protein L0H54_04880 [Alcaligenaceae bacterium]|nr:hypothetical protein [Alcaligenaceae bacterium]